MVTIYIEIPEDAYIQKHTLIHTYINQYSMTDHQQKELVEPIVSQVSNLIDNSLLIEFIINKNRL